MNHVLPATGLRAVIVRLRATKPQKFGFLRHCDFGAKVDEFSFIVLQARGKPRRTYQSSHATTDPPVQRCVLGKHLGLPEGAVRSRV